VARPPVSAKKPATRVKWRFPLRRSLSISDIMMDWEFSEASAGLPNEVAVYDPGREGGSVLTLTSLRALARASDIGTWPSSN
jgi:hypothetical protein